MNRKPDLPIGLTIGDPAGIGPEITISLLTKHKDLRSKILVLANAELMALVMKHHNTKIPLNIISDPIKEKLKPSALNVFNIPYQGPIKYDPGHPDIDSGSLALASIKTAITLAQQKVLMAITTNPVSKENIARAGLKNFIGHTEYIANATKTKHFNMIFAGPHGVVGLVTTHLPLQKVAQHITENNIILSIENLNNHPICNINKAPSIAILGLNPHAGENGLLGNEEKNEILPAIRHCQSKGMKVDGPFPADSFWSRGWKTGKYDTVLAMYHDQGLIPVKSGVIGQSVNITIGLPVIRTSVDHGTAFDIAGKGKADIKGLHAAIQYAIKLYR